MGRMADFRLWVVLAVLVSSSGCAAFRSDIQGKFGPAREGRQAEAGKVSVFFLFSHYEQARGWDAIPKLRHRGAVVKDFDNLFRDALGEVGNIGSYVTDTEQPNDVNQPEIRKARERNRAENDYTVAFRFSEETSFAKQAIAALVSTVSLTVVPAPYKTDHALDVTVFDRAGNRVAAYRRTATLTNWIETLLLFAMPFHPLEGKREEIYSEFLHDVLRQIEHDRVLTRK